MSRASFHPVTTSEHAITGERLSLLAIFAHPEDESFGPAGTLAKYANEGIQVTLVTTTRTAWAEQPDLTPGDPAETRIGARDRLCSCRASGIRRVCFLDVGPGELRATDPMVIESHLVRLVREVQPQVMITLGPQLFANDYDHEIVSRVVAAAFSDAEDATKFTDHFREGLGTFAPQKLYYNVLPSSLIAKWGVASLYAVADDQVTTVLDVSTYSEAMKNTMYCQRSHALDFIGWLTEERSVRWDKEYFSLVESRLNRRPRHERDLFAGLR